MEDPDVLILDEPFNAMDKASMEEVHDLLQRFKAQNKTVLLASHSAEDIARACDVIYEMEDGEDVYKRQTMLCTVYRKLGQEA